MERPESIAAQFDALLSTLCDREAWALARGNGSLSDFSTGSRVGEQARGTSRKIRVATSISALIAFGLGVLIGAYNIPNFEGRELVSEMAPKVVAERIICAESNGDPNAKNKRSSATGAAQFLDETWLHMIRAYRADLAEMSDEKVLALRRDLGLAREITMRFLERNAAMLRRRGLPVTPGSLYLSHFAGGAGAVALMLAADADDAASVMAKADIRGRTKRENLVKANPFLGRFTVADLKIWADKKMKGSNASCRSATSREKSLAGV